MTEFTQEDRDYLYQVFPDQDHEVREGVTSKSGKVRWFVYLKRDSIVRHLDNRFFGEWSMDYHSHRDLEKYSEVYCRITIRGVYRENNGSNTANKANDENVGKGAASDAFKRAASSWGISLYLQDAPQIWTEHDYADSNGRVNDWDKQKQRMNEALQKVYAWLRQLRAGQGSSHAQQSNTETETTDPKWLSKLRKLTKDLYTASDGTYNSFHHNGSIQKAIENGTISTEGSPEVAAAMLLIHRASVDHSLSPDDVVSILEGSVSDWMKAGHTVSEAWTVITSLNQALPPTGTDDDIPF